VPTASFGSFFGAGQEQTTDERAFVELKYQHQFGEDTEVVGRLSYDVYPYLGKYPYDYGANNRPADIAINYDGAFGDWLTTEVQLKQRSLIAHRDCGAEYRENLHQHLFNYDSQHTTYIDDRRNGRSFGVFGQVEAVIRTNLLLNAGVRYDRYDTFGGTLNPRVGLIYNPWRRRLSNCYMGRRFARPTTTNFTTHRLSLRAGESRVAAGNHSTYEIIYEHICRPTCASAPRPTTTRSTI